jgi:AbrB family looped-hinge helix DNA binding protein
MAQVTGNTNQEEWLKVLGKGMITLPKKWRDEMGIENGDVVKARKEGGAVVIEPQPQLKPSAPYRVFSADEITEFLEQDRVADELAKEVEKKVSPQP